MARLNSRCELRRGSLRFYAGVPSRSSKGAKTGGAGRVRTDDPLLAKQVLCQLSYDPKKGNFV